MARDSIVNECKQPKVSSPLQGIYDDWKSKSLLESHPDIVAKKDYCKKYISISDLPTIHIDEDGILTVKQKSNTTKENDNMTIQRKVVTVALIDDDKNLPVENSLLKQWDNIVTEDTDTVTVQEIIMSGEVKDLLETHNKVRAKTRNKDLFASTGKSVGLLPVKLKDLRWSVK